MGKTDGFGFHSIVSLVMADFVCASLIFTSFIDVPSLICVDPLLLALFHSSILIDGLDLMLLTRILLCLS